MKQQVLTRKETLEGIKFAQEQHRHGRYKGKMHFGWDLFIVKDYLWNAVTFYTPSPLSELYTSLGQSNPDTKCKVEIYRFGEKPPLTEDSVRQIIKDTMKDEGLFDVGIHASPEYWKDFDNTVKQQYLK